MELTAMTYNIQSGRDCGGRLDTRFCAEVISRFAPDIAGLNEVRMRTGDIGNAMQARDIGNATGMSWTFGRAIDREGGMYGNAMLTRGAFVASEVVHIPDPEPAMRDATFEHRCVLRCEVALNKARVAVYASHFGLSQIEHELAAETVRGLIARETLPMLFMGDLNMTPDDPLIASIRALIPDVLNGALTPHTFSADRPYERIDHIYASKEFEVLDVICPRTLASDHLPLMARLRLRETGNEK